MWSLIAMEVAWTFQWTGLVIFVGGAVSGLGALVLLALVLWDVDVRRAAKSRG